MRHLTAFSEMDDPEMGRFATPVHEVELEALGQRQGIRVGVLPPFVAMAFSLLGPDSWFLGADFFRGRRLWLDASGGEIAQVRSTWQPSIPLVSPTGSAAASSGGDRSAKRTHRRR